jgi:hypothetical protein
MLRITSLLFPHSLMNASIQRSWENNNPQLSLRIINTLRREGDSNPRYPNRYASLANWWIKPLSHLSGVGFAELQLA